ncbi:hypothetical protein [Dyadobacter sp. CY326]|uniref:hypothetical protein n=1 Tax=Dyadobacter sp. CY326 TaxID=2907300 RepID=UPI001F302093|nr:hypothetical protein [Dyadobacter sp. CY326]MCE7064110.1 hypothetical protein [Dyadobacter sp. CY326]
MKRLLPISLLALLLYNTFGLTFAVLFFDKDYQDSAVTAADAELKVIKMPLPSLPYGGDLNITETPQGLIRQSDNFYNPTEVLHENDTLYVTLKSNQAARDHFVELANAMEMLNSPNADHPESPYGKAVKLLDNLLKTYIPSSESISFSPGSFIEKPARLTSVRYKNIYSAIFMQLPNPPPERC